MWVKQTLGEQRKLLSALLEPPMQEIAKCCVGEWHDTTTLDTVLLTQFSRVPHIQLLYALDKLGRQISANVSVHGADSSYRGQDLSRRPYSVSLYPKRHFMLSSVYISQTTGRPSISAVQPVVNEQQFLGFIVADFDIRHLPLAVNASHHKLSDPSERASAALSHPAPPVTPKTPFSGPRALTLMDQQASQVTDMVAYLMWERGVFHVMLNYTNGVVMVWETRDPYQYHLLTAEQLLTRDTIYHAYQPSTYPAKAAISIDQVREILQRFQTLRLTEGTDYLCSASLNVINGMIGLSFTCDNSQYMRADLFLERPLSDWTRQRNAVNAN
ncbi:PDC sensor domain-containing protein [Thioflexithrix psekupsensis]|uniref:Cache domain-containing protein n=1 Tax=Thioflexithrix psekupsensis TaxID=1570016 RepID=A0A251XBX3_9GAMM|nr:PDC sensor domain-containing protein [Thioflexithrix psekupsensis]OUD16226.1 hypothetical protein TPSD3_00425 [Thioflexithrix psekupsensis]